MKNSKNTLPETSEIAKQIYKKSSEYKFPLTPENYTIWYAYFTQSDKNLKSEINKKISSKKVFTDAVSVELYEKYFKQKDNFKITQELNLKTKDFPARYGGEEFIVLLAETSLENSYAVAEDIREKVAKNRVKIVKTGEFLDQITVSMRTAVVNLKDTVITLLDRVDAALYLAKGMGAIM